MKNDRLIIDDMLE